jgi:hypothetical protein
MEPLPYTYHDIIVLLHDADITHFQTGSKSASSHPNDSSIPGVHDTVFAADQM